MSRRAAQFEVGVVAIIHSRSGLLALRRCLDESEVSGLWETVAGHIEPGEEPEDAVSREILEECGICVNLCRRPVGAFLSTHHDPPILLIYFLAEYLSGDVRLSEEHTEYEWLSAAQFIQVISFPRLAQIVSQYFATDLGDRV